MKRTTWVLAVVMALGMAAAPVVHADQAVAKDNVVDSIGDWFATIGKSGMDKDSIKAKRQAERAARRAQHAAEQGAKKAGNAMEKAGKDLKKGLN